MNDESRIINENDLRFAADEIVDRYDFGVSVSFAKVPIFLRIDGLSDLRCTGSSGSSLNVTVWCLERILPRAGWLVAGD